MDRYKFIAILSIFCLTLFSCGYSEADAEKYLPGKYLYKIPSGETQLLEIYSDFTFKQIVYSEDDKILHSNKGKMSVDGNRVKLEDWLECYELDEQRLLAKPYNVYSTNYWRKEKNGDVVIIMFDQTNYIFKKIRR